jgi:hypothetical protein
MGTYLKYVFITALTTGTFLAFHDHWWPWAIIPVSIVWGMIALGLALERREREKERHTV